MHMGNNALVKAKILNETKNDIAMAFIYYDFSRRKCPTAALEVLQLASAAAVCT